MEKKIEDTLAKKYSNSMEKINLEIDLIYIFTTTFRGYVSRTHLKDEEI